MTVIDIITKGGGALILLMTLIQLTPIKINPWSAIAKLIGRAINSEVLERVGKMDSDLSSIRSELSRQEAITCRARILRFGDECLHGEMHSKDHFDQILRDIKTYELYCDAHREFENNITELTSKRIKDIYTECLKENTFL